MPRRFFDRQVKKLRSPSLRFRLTLWTVLVSLVIQFTLGAVAFFYQRRTLDQLYSSKLDAKLSAVAVGLAKLDRPAHDEDLKRLAAESLFVPSPEGYVLALFDESGRMLAHNGQAVPGIGDASKIIIASPDHDLIKRLPLASLSDAEDVDGIARVAVKPLSTVDGKSRMLVAGVTDSTFEASMRLTGRLFLLILPVGLIGTGVAAWLISGLALTPLRQLREMSLTFFPETIRQDVGFPQTSRELSSFQQGLADARTRLQQAFRAQDRLIANLSHELKTPIAVLLVEASTLSRTDMPPEAREFVTSVQQEMRRLGKIIEGFLVLSKAQGGQRISTGRKCDLNDIVMEAVQVTAAVAKERGVETRMRLCETGDSTTVEGDPELLRTLLEQLLRGAMTATPKGKDIVISVGGTDKHCHITVRDHGMPVAESSISTLFDWFTEAGGPCSERKSPGLAVAKGIAELHGGKLRVINIEGGGCEFIVELPTS